MQCFEVTLEFAQLKMGQLGLSRVNYVFVFCLVQIIAEGANGPTTPDADKVFLENNVMVIPVSTQAHKHTSTHTGMQTKTFCSI